MTQGRDTGTVRRMAGRILLIIAGMELEFIRERTTRSLLERQKRGIKGGRPKHPFPLGPQEVRHLQGGLWPQGSTSPGAVAVVRAAAEGPVHLLPPPHGRQHDGFSSVALTRSGSEPANQRGPYKKGVGTVFRTTERSCVSQQLRGTASDPSQEQADAARSCQRERTRLNAASSSIAWSDAATSAWCWLKPGIGPSAPASPPGARAGPRSSTSCSGYSVPSSGEPSSQVIVAPPAWWTKASSSSSKRSFGREPRLPRMARRRRRSPGGHGGALQGGSGPCHPG
jgi:hypothetical protein